MNIKQKICLAVGLILIVLTLLVGIIVKSLVSEIKQSSDVVKKSNEELLTLQVTSRDYLNELESDYNEIKKDVDLIGRGFLTEEEIVGFFIEMENIASSTQNELEIEPGEFPVFTLYLLGDFADSMRFMGLLESSNYFININSVSSAIFNATSSLSGEEKQEAKGKVKTVLNITAHSRK